MQRHVLGLIGFVLATALSASLVVVFNAHQRVLTVSELPTAYEDAMSTRLTYHIGAGCGQHSGPPHVLAFRGALLEFSPGMTVACGVVFPHQVALYRVDEVLAGRYAERTMVVEHPYCGTSALDKIQRRDLVELTATIVSEYSYVTVFPGIREYRDVPGPIYVARDLRPRQ